MGEGGLMMMMSLSCEGVLMEVKVLPLSGLMKTEVEEAALFSRPTKLGLLLKTGT